MKRFVIPVLILSVLVCAFPSAASAAPLSEEQKIVMLIDYVRSLKGAVFIRNGSEYPAGQAADHIAMKRGKAGSRVKTAREFIDRVASKSYLTGKSYTVRLSDGSTVRAGELLLRRLNEIESAE